MTEALVLSASSGEEMETGEVDERREKGMQKSKRISRAPIDSDDSEPEQERGREMEEPKKEAKSMKERKKREKSQRHREKKEKHSKAVQKLKKKERFSETNEVKCSLEFSLSSLLLLLGWILVNQGFFSILWNN